MLSVSDRFCRTQAICADLKVFQAFSKSSFSLNTTKMPHKLFICNKKINLLCGYLKIFFVIFLLVHFLIATHISWRWKQMDTEKNLSPLPALFFSLCIAVFFRQNYKWAWKHIVLCTMDRENIFQTIPPAADTTVWKYQCKHSLMKSLKFCRLTMLQKNTKTYSFFWQNSWVIPYACLIAQMF